MDVETAGLWQAVCITKFQLFRRPRVRAYTLSTRAPSLASQTVTYGERDYSCIASEGPHHRESASGEVFCRHNYDHRARKPHDCHVRPHPHVKTSNLHAAKTRFKLAHGIKDVAPSFIGDRTKFVNISGYKKHFVSYK